MKKVVCLFLFSVVFANALANAGLAKTPQMGWNSWNKFATAVNETVIRSTIDLIIQLKLNTLGYNYINIDDGWAESRDDRGYITVDKKAFPGGIKALADYAHSKGLLFGIYSDAGTRTCAGRPGSLGYETQDAQSYAEWGVDYLKYDNCYTDGSLPQKRFPVMAKALQATGRPIFYSMCEWGVEKPAQWARSIGGNSWRTTGDINDSWNSMILNVIYNDADAELAGPGGWNDPDMLEVGNGGMNDDEYRVHFSLWCLVKSPLLIGCDLSAATQTTLSILGNYEAIAVNQDPLGKQGKLVLLNGQHQIWLGELSDGWAVVSFGVVSDPQKVTFDVAQMTGMKSYHVRDLWAHKDLGVITGPLTLPIDYHRCVFYKLTPAV